MKKFFSGIEAFEKNINNWLLLVILFVFSLLRVPSLIEPDWYGDEGIYQVMGMAVREGRMLYQGIWDNKPPILYLIYALFNGDLFSARLLSLIFGVLAIIFIFLLASRLFKTRFAILLTTSFFAIIFGLPIIEGNIANAENFMLAPILLAAFFLITQKNNSKYFLFSGLLLSFAFLTKIVAVFDFAAFFVFLIVLKYYKDFSFSYILKEIFSSFKNGKIIKEFKNETVFVLSFLTPVFLTFIFFFLNGALGDYLKAAFSQNVGYVGYGNHLLFPMDLLFFKLILLLLSIILCIRFREKLGISGFFIFIWLSFSVYNALFSQRPYTHYLLVLLPSLSLLLGYVFSKNVLVNKKILIPNLIVIFFLFFLLNNSFNIYEKSFQYYKNYVNFILGKKNAISYQAFFDRNTPRDYDIVGFIKANTTKNDNIFLWSDSAQIYALSGKLPPGRYAVSYHITFYKNAIIETQKDIDMKKPKYIISTKDTSGIVSFLNNYNLKYNIKNTKIYERKI